MIVESVGSLYSSVIKKMGQLLCCVQVKQSTVVMKEKFGRFNEVLKPGCHYLPWFFGNQVRGHFSLQAYKHPWSVFSIHGPIVILQMVMSRESMIWQHHFSGISVRVLRW